MVAFVLLGAGTDMKTHITVMGDVSVVESNAEHALNEEERNMHYCTECGWSMDGDDRATEHERNRRAIEHHVETGHTIVSRSPPMRPTSPTDGGPEDRHRAVE